MTWSRDLHGRVTRGRGFVVVMTLVLLLLAGTVAFWPYAPSASAGSGTNAPWAYQMQNTQNTGYSPQTLINPGNVGGLHLLWRTDATGLAGTPVIYDGIVYMFGAGACPCLSAIRESNGQILWQDGKGGTQLTSTLFKTRVGVTIDRGLVFAGDQNNRVYALNALTGAMVWNTSLIQGVQGNLIPYSGAEATPLAWGGRIYIGVVFGDNGVRGFVRSFNETNGNLLWTFYVTPPEPITAGTNQTFYKNSWATNGTSGCICGGGSVWNVPAVDPSTGTIYFETGNPWPLEPPTVRAPNSTYTNLYTDSVIAVDAATGTMKWYYQEVPGYYNGDLDLGMPVQLFNTTINGVRTEVLGSGGKAGYYYEFNAQTGQEIFKTKVGIHINENGTSVGPSWRAQINTLSTYDSLTNMIYTVAENHGSNCKLSSGLITCKEFTTPSTSNSTLYAIDASTGQVAWSFNEDGYGTGASSTNSLVFTSDANHHFYAFNGFSGGSPLWNYTDNGGGKTWSWGPPAVTDGMVFESTFGNTTSGYLEAFTASVIRSTLVTVQNNAYNPNPVVVVVGVNNTVTWVNYDSVAHTVTADDGSFDSGLIQPGGSYTHTFTTPGTYEYNSTVQPGMTGKLEVEALVTSTTSTTTSSPTSSGFVFSVKVTDAGVPYLGAWVSINEGTTTVASGYTDSNGIFQANLPQGTYSATACETSQCVVFVGGVFPADSQGGSITLDFTSATTVSSTSTSTSTTIITTQTSSSTQSQTQTSSQTSSTVTTSSYSITTSSSSSSVSGTSSSSIYLYAGLGIVAVGVVVLVALLLTRSRRGK